MQFPNADEDEGDFTLTTAARSRLSSLFQSESASGNVNQALTFQAPKQPRKNDNTQSSSGIFKLIHAATVHAYKLIDGNYVNQGKLGCAILGIHESSSYKFLLYKGKQVQVTSCNIVPSFKFHVQPNNYANFYDDKNENWSLNFDNETALKEFAKQIAVATANSEGKSQSTLVIQDLALGEGPCLDTGHSAEVKYTGWLLTNYSFGQVFDSNMKSESAFRLRLGKSKIIQGWSEGLVGAQKGSRRLLVVPPSLAYGAEGIGLAVPPNSTLIFDVLITKVKVSRESSRSPIPMKLPENSPDKRPDVLPRSSISQEDNIRMRGASISEQLTQSPKKDKAQLISRMAKMGTATLPLQGAIPAQVSSESENEEDPPEESHPVQASRSATASPKSLSKHNSRNNSVSSAFVQPVQSHPVLQESIPLQVNQNSSQIPCYSQATLPAQQPYVGQALGYPSYPTQLPSPYHVQQSQFQMQNMPGMMPSASMADAHLPLLITETRGQNTEVRLSLSKITDKVDTVIQKVDDMRLQQGRSSGFSPATYMECTLLVQNIERIVQENNQLKEDAEIKNSKIQALNEKICDLLQRNQRFFEESNSMLEQRSDSIQAVSSQSQAKLLNLEKERVKLISDLSDSASKICTLERELNQLHSRENQLKQRLMDYEKTETQNNESNEENESLVNSLQNQVKNLKHENSTLLEKSEELEKQLENLSKSKAALLKRSEESELKIEEIKSKAAMQLREMKESLHGDASTNNNVIETLREENDNLSREKDKLHSEAENLMKQLKSSETVSEKKLQKMQSELEDSLTWKKKYEVFYEKMLKMKTRYDAQVAQLTSEVQQLQVAGSAPVSSDFSGEIKKIMSMLYKVLQGKFEANSTYPGAKVLEMTLQAIRGLTFQMLQMKSRASSNSSEQDIEPRKESASSDSDAIPSTSKEPSSQGSSSEDGNKESGTSVATDQLNGVAEEISHSNAEARETTLASDVTEGASNATRVDEEGCDTNKLDSDSKESATEENSVNNSSDASNSVSGNNISEEPTEVLKESKEVEQVQSDKRTSPDSSQHLPATADLPSDGSKIWRPQPPPLFDDDDEDEDDDDWLK